MDRHLLQLYADFIVKVGVNVNPGQYFLINCPVECAEFGRACAKAGFEAGAKDVIVRFHDEKLARIRYENAAEETLAATMPYELRSWLDYAEAPGGACRLYIDADDPEAYAGLDGAKINRANTARAKALKPWTEYTMNDRLQWCVAAVPGRAWVSRVFPELPTEQAVEKLWQLIFDACRVTGGDPVGEWKKHIAMLTQKKDQLNRWDLESVHFSSANGTDVTIGLADGAVWEGANSRSERGIDFIANLPTEEVFTAPHRTKVNGVVKGTRPYAYNGQLIKGFSVTFKDGKVVAHSAEENDALLAELLATDEGACHIGEVALVPKESPIRATGVLFYSTLFDENAACHIAFGAGYPTTVKGGQDLSREQLLTMGVNDSAIHEDVMIGAEDTTVTGLCKNGDTVKIFENGSWAF